MNNLDKQYLELLQDILDNGYRKEDRTGTGTISVFGRQIRHKMSEGFPLLTTKKMAWKTMVTELLWFLRGDTDIRFLWENNCSIWDGDWEKHYKKTYGETYTLEEVKQMVKDGKHKFHDSLFDMGPIYGKQWRKWKTEKFKKFFNKYGYEDEKRIYIDQIANLINDLKTNPDSRRLMVTAWNPADLEDSVLPPCHYGFQVYTRELSEDERNEIRDMQYFKNRLHQEITGNDTKIDLGNIPTRAISLMWNQRSCDFPLGIPANTMSYALLLMILAKQVNMVPEELIGNLGDCHIYLNQIDGVKEQLDREPFPLPNVKLLDKVVNDLSEYTYQDFILENYQSHPKIYFPLSN